MNDKRKIRLARQFYSDKLYKDPRMPKANKLSDQFCIELTDTLIFAYWYLNRSLILLFRLIKRNIKRTLWTY